MSDSIFDIFDSIFKYMIIIVISLIFIVIPVILTTIHLYNINHEYNFDATVVSKQMIYKQGTFGLNVEYIVTTDKGTFQCRNLYIKGLYDKENIFNNLKEQNKYNLNIIGYNRGFFLPYPTIKNYELKN